MASSVPLWAPGQGHGLEGQTTSWALYDPTMAETNKPMSVDKLNQNIIKDGSCIKHNVPKFVKLSDAAIGMMTLLLTTVMRHAYYGGDFNSNGQPSQGRPHVGNGFLIVDSSGQVLVGQVNHRKAKETYDLTGTKVSRTWPCYNINGRKALGAGYHMHTGSQSNRIVLHSNARQTRAPRARLHAEKTRQNYPRIKYFNAKQIDANKTFWNAKNSIRIKISYLLLAT
ncbi:MAG: hypothetical protein Q9194_007305 [Teloschistes cf. exilis]